MSSNPLPNKTTFQEKLVWNLRNNPNSKSECRHQGKSSQNIKENQSLEIIRILNLNVDTKGKVPITSKKINPVKS